MAIGGHPFAAVHGFALIDLADGADVGATRRGRHGHRQGAKAGNQGHRPQKLQFRIALSLLQGDVHLDLVAARRKAGRTGGEIIGIEHVERG